MDWIRVRVDLVEVPEIRLIAESTGRSIHEVMGLLVGLWGWLSRVSSNGYVRGITAMMLASTIGADADFWSIVESMGWLRFHARGVSVPHWDRWLSTGSKFRAMAALRQHKSRATRSRKCHTDVTKKCDEVVTHAKRDVTKKRDQMRGDERRREEKREEDIQDCSSSSNARARSDEVDPPDPPQPTTDRERLYDWLTFSKRLGHLKALEILDRGLTVADSGAWEAYEVEYGTRLMLHYLKKYIRPSDIPAEKPGRAATGDYGTAAAEETMRWLKEQEAKENDRVDGRGQG